MGLNEGSHSSKTYLNLVGGKLARRYKEHQEVGGKQVTVEREIKDRATGEVTKVVIERHYQDIDGLLTKAFIDTKGDFGSRLILEMMDGEEEFTIQIPLESSYGRAVMMRVPNVNAEKPLTIRPYSFDDDNGKTQTGVVIYQEDCGWEKDKVPYKWTKDNPGSMPPWEVTEVAGKKKWNSDKQTNFLAQHFEQWANKIGEISVGVEELAKAIDAEPEIMKMEEDFAKDQVATKSNDSAKENVNKIDDLPF